MTMDALALAFMAAIGLAVGSFLNVCIHRVPLRLSVASPGSRCPACGYALRWTDNIPVLSYVALRGRCRGCGSPISLQYPIVELITMGVFVLHYLVIGADALLIPRLAFASAMIVLFAIDYQHFLLPNVITLPGIVVGLLFSLWFPPGFRDALIGVAVGGGLLWLIGEAYYRFAGQEGMGGGDVKMLAMIGAFLGWQLTIVTLILSSMAGALVGLGVIVSRRGGMDHQLPYGTFLALAAIAASLAGGRLIIWYLGFY